LIEDALLNSEILAIGEGLATKVGDQWGDPRRKRGAWEVPEQVEENNCRQPRHKASSTRRPPFYRSVRKGAIGFEGLGMWLVFPRRGRQSHVGWRPFALLDENLQHGEIGPFLLLMGLLLGETRSGCASGQVSDDGRKNLTKTSD